MDQCSIWDLWRNNNFTPCFRERYLNTFIISLCIVLSLIGLFKNITKARHGDLTTPLNKKTNTSYGTTESSPIEDDSLSSSSTLTPTTSLNHGFLFNLSRAVLSTLQIFIAFCMLGTFNDTKDVPIEGVSDSDIKYMYYSNFIFWFYASILAIINVGLSLSTHKPLADKICNHLNLLYAVAFLIQLINVTSYYLVHDISLISNRYGLSLFSDFIDLVLLVIVMNEHRYAPSTPIITENGRVMSGERWASIYSKFMFSWVNVMMKEGDKRTLDDKDLLELPHENLAKNALGKYRKQTKVSMAMKLLYTFKWPLFEQFWYCMFWSVLMFGPPLFLNKIIKYIENIDPDTRAPASSAYLYVLGLFLTSSGQSLAYQQALYIGRTLGIRIQSIIIGEVYSKSLRRRDETGTEETMKDKSKGNVNNLLSVDAQKMGDLTAYIFYIYCFFIQVTICVWSLYKLLGTSSLYGVLVICLTQPLVFYLSGRFQKSHQAVMKCTDKRISIMNELLSAIRIVKFFAWEKQFRDRVIGARDVELKAIRTRLLMFMWVGNVWFLIPVLIMVTVFYDYTRTNALTASTAFTALALFNNFKTTLDELPVITSFVLQANVSMGRIETFLKEEEVVLPKQNKTSTTHIGFIDNATFSWEKEGAIAALKDLNLSFPLHRFSIVCGSTGSGKTTLLSSLLGETYCMSGSAILPRKDTQFPVSLGGAVSGIAYVAQTAWLQNCSIRDNILFGLPYDEERYNNVLYMTALTRDLDILEYGDSTEVGEKGITLSGGQKQRVAIARAVYSQAEIVILDDCLSAVDAHTAKHLYQHCLMGQYMSHRTVILVTHHVSLCLRGASYVVALDEGRVAASGTPIEVIRTGVLGDELSEEGWMDDINASEEAATNGPIPVLPTTVTNTGKDGAGKLTQEEKRAQGSVDWAVYGTYYYASGGFFFWVAVVLFFCLAQGAVLGQDYWIKVWSSAYTAVKDAMPEAAKVMTMHTVSRASELHSYASVSIAALMPSSVLNFATEIKNEPVNVGYYLGIYFLIGMGSLILTTLRSLVLFMGSLKASRKIHSKLLDRILSATVRFYDTTPLGRVVNRFSSDLETIDQAIAPSLSFLLYSIIATIYVVILVSVITPAFIVPGIFIALLFKSIGTYYLNTSRDMKRLNSVSRSPIYVQFNETINGVATIRAFGAQKRFIQENFNRIDSNNRPFIWMWATNRWLHCRVDVLGAFVGFCTGAVLIMSRDWVNAGLAGLSLSYSLTFTHHVLWVVRMYAMNEMNMNALERVHEYLEIDQEPAAHIEATKPQKSWPQAGSVKVENLVVQYAPDTPAVLRNISFETRPREKIGIVGRTGSGKSTLALSIFRFMEPTSGHVFIDGVDIHTLGLTDLRAQLTIIPQDPVLFSGTLRSNLDPFNEYDDAILWAALKRSHLVDDGKSSSAVSQSSSSSTESISLDSLVTENGSNWSQGQRQLIALARALVKRTALIILDEATSSVDFDTDHQIQETIRAEFRESSLLCIAHRIKTVADYDRILVLDQGQIVEFDTPYTLMKNKDGVFHQMCERSGEYAELWNIARAKHDGEQL